MSNNRDKSKDTMWYDVTVIVYLQYVLNFWGCQVERVLGGKMDLKFWLNGGTGGWQDVFSLIQLNMFAL